MNNKLEPKNKLNYHHQGIFLPAFLYSFSFFCIQTEQKKDIITIITATTIQKTEELKTLLSCLLVGLLVVLLSAGRSCKIPFLKVSILRL